MKTVLLKSEAFNARASEAIRTAILEVRVRERRTIDFEDQTEIACGEVESSPENEEIVSFEVGGTAEFLDDAEEEMQTGHLPCVCRGELLISKAEPHAEGLDYSVKVRSVELVLNESLARH